MTISVVDKLPAFLERERVLSAKQGAAFLGISVATFRRLHWSGKLPPAIRVSERRLGWRARDLIVHLADRSETGA